MENKEYDEEFAQIPIKIQTYTTYEMDENHIFHGQKDTAILEKISKNSLINSDLTKEAFVKLEESDFQFIEKMYDTYIPNQNYATFALTTNFNPHMQMPTGGIILTRPLAEDLNIKKENSKTYDIHTNIRDKFTISYDEKQNLNELEYSENMSKLYSLFLKNASIKEKIIKDIDLVDNNVKTDVGKQKYSTLLADENTQEPLIDLIYIDVFRKENKDLIRHCGEYRYNDGWITIPTGIKTSDSRDKNWESDKTTGNEYINVPLEQDLYIMLSNVMQPVVRIEEIRKNIDTYERVSKFHKPKEIIKAWIDYYDGKTQYNKEIMDNTSYDNGQLILFVPDYFSYSKKLYALIKAYKSINEKYIGIDDDELKLFFLVMSTCVAKDGWRYLDKNAKYDDKMIKAYRNMTYNNYLLNYTAEKLVWWITQPAYCEMLCDFNSNKEYIGYQNKIVKQCLSVFQKLLHTVCHIPVVICALDQFWKTTEKQYLNTLCKITGKKNIDELRNELIKNQFKAINTLDSYSDYDGKNFFEDILLKGLKNADDITLGIIECFSDYMVKNATTFAKTEEELANYIFNMLTLGNLNDNYETTCSIQQSYLIVKRNVKIENFIDKADSFKALDFLFTSINAKFLVEKISNDSLQPDEYLDLFNNIVKLTEFCTYFGLKVYYLKKGLPYTFKQLAKHEYWSAFAVLGGLIEMTHRIVSASVLLTEGDTEAAVLEGAEAVIVIATITLIFIPGYGWAALLCIVLSIFLDMLIDYYKTDNVEKWLKCCKYGCEYKAIADKKAKLPNSTFNTLYNNYFTDKSIKDFKKNWTSDDNSIQNPTQISAYYRILNDFSFELSIYKDKMTKGNVALCFKISALSFLDFQKLELKINIKNGNYKYSYPLGETKIQATNGKYAPEETKFYSFSMDNLLYTTSKENGACLIGILKCCSGILEKDRDYAVYNDITHKEKILKSGKTKEIIINKDYYSLSKDIKNISSIDIRYYGPNYYTDSSGVTIQKTIEIKKIEEIKI